MDEKTEELRDIFMSVSDEETVTERQEEARGSLSDDGPGTDEIEDVVATMRERYDFDSSLSDAELCRVVEEFYDGVDDEEIADAIDADAETVFVARMDLHLLTDDDLDPESFDPDRARERLDAVDDPEAVAESLSADPEEMRRFRRALRARNESLRASERFRQRFEDLIADVDLSRRLASEVREDGLEDATEGMETDVSL